MLFKTMERFIAKKQVGGDRFFGGGGAGGGGLYFWQTYLYFFISNHSVIAHGYGKLHRESKSSPIMPLAKSESNLKIPMTAQ